MKKAILAITLMITSISSHAASKEWFSQGSPNYIIASANNLAYAEIEVDPNSCESLISIGLFTTVLFDFSDGTPDLLNINGTDVKVSYAGKSQGGDSTYFIPTTNAGKRFLMNEFIRKSSVTIEKNFTFTAKGFSKAKSELTSQCFRHKAKIDNAI